ncbi:uncharacterized protein VTP21DRAFT_5708 [Calcarisporiella thermophila]|uniref:uncharacterized protein n=1 Tax=Calcarisporiella thermophila TaxID=911321 RepID=UPI0037430220
MLSSHLLSSVFGYVSFIIWVLVFTPQFLENYWNKSTDGLSVAFIFIWLIADVLNLAGALLQNLLFTMLVLASYYIMTDFVLLGQVWYYRNTTRSRNASDEESKPLLNHSQPRAKEKKQNYGWIWVGIMGFIILVVILVVIHTKTPPLPPRPSPKPDPNDGLELSAQVIGWASALLYICSRFPQIRKNYVTKSVEGLSPIMFCFTVLGNITYCLSIFTYSSEASYLLKNLPWLVGSFGTLFLDFVIFGQFYSYSK